MLDIKTALSSDWPLKIVLITLFNINKILFILSIFKFFVISQKTAFYLAENQPAPASGCKYALTGQNRPPNINLFKIMPYPKRAGMI
jgi:hypothetical protein